VCIKLPLLRSLSTLFQNSPRPTSAPHRRTAHPHPNMMKLITACLALGAVAADTSEHSPAPAAPAAPAAAVQDNSLYYNTDPYVNTADPYGNYAGYDYDGAFSLPGEADR